MIKIFIIDIITPVEHTGGFQPFLAHADVSVKENEEKRSVVLTAFAIASPGRLFLSGTLIRTVNTRFLSMEESKPFFLRSHFSDPFYEYRISRKIAGAIIINISVSEGRLFEGDDYSRDGDYSRKYGPYVGSIGRSPSHQRAVSK